MKIEVTVDAITLDTLIADSFSYDGDGELVPDGGTRTLADLVAEKITDRLTADDRYNSLRKAVLRIRDEEIRTAVQPLIQEALTRPIQRTNTWGEATGQQTTLSEIIRDEARKLFEPSGHSSYDRKPPYITQVVNTEVQKAFAEDIAAYVKKARAHVTKQLSDDIGQKITNIVTDALRTPRTG